MHFFLGQLTRILPPENAEKLLVSVLLLALFFSIRYAIRCFGGSWMYASWLCPLIFYNRFLHLGLYNFILSAAVYLFVLGYWSRHRKEAGLRDQLVLAGSSIFLYLTHPYFSVWLFFTAAVWILWEMRTRALPWPEKIKGVFRKTLIPFFPALVLTAYFFISFLTQKTPAEIFPQTSSRQLNFFNLRALWSFGYADYFLMALLAWAVSGMLAIGIFLKIRRKSWGSADLLIFMIVCAWIGFSVYPDTVNWVPDRLVWTALLTAILWIGTVPYPKIVKTVFISILLCISGFWLPYLGERYQAINRDISEYLSAEPHLKPGRTLLVLSVDQKDDRMCIAFKPYRHLGSLIAAKKKMISLTFHGALVPYEPLRYQKAVDPYRYLGGYPEGDPPLGIDLEGYAQKTGGKGSVDYVGIWQTRPQKPLKALEKIFFGNIFPQLKKDYQLLHISENKKMHLYIRKDLLEKNGESFAN